VICRKDELKTPLSKITSIKKKEGETCE